MYSGPSQKLSVMFRFQVRLFARRFSLRQMLKHHSSLGGSHFGFGCSLSLHISSDGDRGVEPRLFGVLGSQKTTRPSTQIYHRGSPLQRRRFSLFSSFQAFRPFRPLHPYQLFQLLAGWLWRWVGLGWFRVNLGLVLVWFKVTFGTAALGS